MFKRFISMVLLVLSLVCVCSFSHITINATEDNPIYYEESVKEVNNLATGITHKIVSGYSQVTDENLISKGATEAGYGSSVPLVRNKYYSQQINLLEIPYESESKIVPWGVIKNGTWSLATVKTMAEDYESTHPGYKVLAAINGDFFDINGTNNYPYTPLGTLYVDGNLYKQNASWGILGFNNSLNGPRLVGKVASEGISFTNNPYLFIYNDNGEIVLEKEINIINHGNNNDTTPAGDDIALYYGVYDSAHKVTPISVDNAYIVEKAENTVAYTDRQFFGKGQISKIGSTTTLGKNQFAIVTTNSEVTTLLKENVTIKVQYKNTNSEFSDCDGMIGMHDYVVIDGEPCYINEGYGNDRLPRTILGTKEDGSVVMLTIDGRQAQKGFYGANQEEYAAIAQYYGIVNGYQMDGGGSTTMIVLKNGELTVCNSPSDSAGLTARSDSVCILVVAKVPEITYQTEVTDTQVTFNVTANPENVENIYIEMNGEKKPLVNNTVKFENLTSNTEYNYELYQKIGDEFKSLVYQGVVQTDKAKPTIDKLHVSLVKVDDEWKYKIVCDINDKDLAVINASFVYEGKSYWLRDGSFTLPTTSVNVLCSTGWTIKFVYKLSNNQGSKTDVIEETVIVADNALIVFDAYNEIINDIIKRILE